MNIRYWGGGVDFVPYGLTYSTAHMVKVAVLKSLTAEKQLADSRLTQRANVTHKIISSTKVHVSL